MNNIKPIFQSSLGKKYLMAISGFFLFLFVIAHLIGNLQVFLGPEAINRYGHFLQSNLELVWPARIALLVLLVLHIWSASKLSVENRAARPAAYAVYRPVGSSYASRTMLMSGIIIFVFIVYHLLHYTLCIKEVNLTQYDFRSPEFTQPIPGTVGLERHDVYRMMVVGFKNPIVSGFYILGVGLLCLH